MVFVKKLDFQNDVTSERGRFFRSEKSIGILSIWASGKADSDISFLKNII